MLSAWMDGAAIVFPEIVPLKKNRHNIGFQLFCLPGIIMIITIIICFLLCAVQAV